MMSSRPNRAWPAAVACGLLLAAYAAAAWSAARRQSPTFDEPSHALAGWLERYAGDYRLDPQNPPLWKAWATLPNGRGALAPDLSAPEWREMTGNVRGQLPWMTRTMFQTPGNDGLGVVRRAQAMMLVWAVVLGGLVAAAAWRLGGPVAAVVATALFSLDPNFIAHGPLMKNDVAITVALTLLVAAAAWAGRRASVASVGAVAVAVALGLTIKFTGLIAAGLLPAVLGLRAWRREPWPAFGRVAATRASRFAVATIVCLVAAVGGYAGVWAAYGFRYAAMPDPAVPLDLTQLVELARTHAHRSDGGLPLPVRAALWVDDHRLLPQPYTAGYLYTYAFGVVRPAYLDGQVSDTGWWYYVPVVMAVKTPVATLVATLLAVVVTRAVVRRRPRGQRVGWTAVAVVVPAGLYALASVSSNLAIGVRHAFPLYVAAFVSIGWAAAHAIQLWPRPTRVVMAMLGLTLAAESATAWPADLAFVNGVGRLAGGGLRLVGDSNLDWGQGLPALADWQRAHPADRLYLCYFGSIDPAVYGLRYRRLPGGFARPGEPTAYPDPREPCVVAYGATDLQGIYRDWTDLGDTNRPWLDRKPDAVLDGCIYLFRIGPTGTVNR